VNILLDKILIKANEEEVCVAVVANHPHCLTVITPINVKLVCFEVETFHSTSAIVKGTAILLKHSNARTLYPSCYGKRVEVINIG